MLYISIILNNPFLQANIFFHIFLLSLKQVFVEKQYFLFKKNQEKSHLNLLVQVSF